MVPVTTKQSATRFYNRVAVLRLLIHKNTCGHVIFGTVK